MKRSHDRGSSRRVRRWGSKAGETAGTDRWSLLASGLRSDCPFCEVQRCAVVSQEKTKRSRIWPRPWTSSRAFARNSASISPLPSAVSQRSRRRCTC